MEFCVCFLCLMNVYYEDANETVSSVENLHEGEERRKQAEALNLRKYAQELNLRKYAQELNVSERSPIAIKAYIDNYRKIFVRSNED